MLSLSLSAVSCSQLSLRLHSLCVSSNHYVCCMWCVCIILCVYMYDHTVPTPAVALSVPSGPLYEGTSQTLTCTVTLPDTVDTDVTVTVQWTPDTTSDCVSISAVSSMRSPFISTLTLSPLSMTDPTQYSCLATADSASQYIINSSPGQSSVENITVTGMTTDLHTIVMHIMCIIYDPTLFSSGSSRCHHHIFWKLYFWSELFSALFS